MIIVRCSMKFTCFGFIAAIVSSEFLDLHNIFEFDLADSYKSGMIMKLELQFFFEFHSVWGKIRYRQ